MSLRGKIALNDLIVFNAVAQTRSYTAAAELLGVASAKIIHEVERLESQLGSTLFTRNANKLTLTKAGKALCEDAQPDLQQLLAAVDSIRSADSALTGTLRIASSTDHAVRSLAPALAQFAALYPKLHIDLRTGGRASDVIGEETDIAIRIGGPQDASVNSVKLREFPQYVVASPGYLRKMKPPQVPQDLLQADWISLTALPSLLTWRFTSTEQETQTIRVQSRIKADTPATLRSMILHGAGVSVLDEYSAQNDLESGLLVRLLDGWSLPNSGIHAIFPSGPHPPRKVHAFIAFYQAFLQANNS